jgi:solute carrier family 12 (potassium/chloride transporters), member 9
VIVFVERREDVEEEKGRVQELLENLRIDATLIVLCLSSTQTYKCIINGEPDATGRVDEVLGEDQWWTDLKKLRHASGSSTPMGMSAFRQASRAFVHSLADWNPTNRGELVAGPLARRPSTSSSSRPVVSLSAPKRRQSMAVLPPSFTMRMSVSKPGYFSHASSESSSEDEVETDEESVISDTEDDTIAPDHSGNDSNIADLQTDYFSSAYLSPGSGRPKTPKSPLDELSAGKRGAFSASAHASLAVDDEDKPHVSFKATPHPHYQQQDLELDFNVLPAKAQYLILNDLIRSHSQDTAVVFTTLPAPPPGTYQDEEKSVEYVSGLELMCEDIPPVLLIHSNSLVVTLAL